MCTVTIVPRDEEPGGFRLVANRDERRNRPAAVAPNWRRHASRQVAYPIDPRGGGTWVGVNDAGLAMALLNRNPLDGPRRHAHAPSRGLIIPALLGCRRVDDAVRLLRAFDCARFNAFSLMVVDRRDVAVYTHDHRVDAIVSHPLARPVFQTSSSLGDDLVDAPRRRLFEALVLNEVGRERLLGQHRLHRHQWTARPDISVLMERADAATVSRTTIDVTNDSVGISYEPLFQMRAPILTRAGGSERAA